MLAPKNDDLKRGQSILSSSSPAVEKVYLPRPSLLLNFTMVVTLLQSKITKQVACV